MGESLNTASEKTASGEGGIPKKKTSGREGRTPTAPPGANHKCHCHRTKTDHPATKKVVKNQKPPKRREMADVKGNEL